VYFVSNSYNKPNPNGCPVCATLQIELIVAGKPFTNNPNIHIDGGCSPGLDTQPQNFDTLLELSRERGMPLFSALGTACRGWARAKLGEAQEGIAELRNGLTAFTEQGNRTYVPFLQMLLAECEAEQGGDGALARIEEVLAVVAETGEHWTDALLHRIRGEILLKRNIANTASAEEAFLTAVGIAQQQKAKSFELQAALSVAKLYQSTNRAAAAHAVLASALEGISPTSEFPEIAEAQRLFGS
jgi:predicted ATPase